MTITSYSSLEKLRVTAYVDRDAYKSIEKLAEKEKRSLSQMVDVLLQEALENRSADRRS